MYTIKLWKQLEHGINNDNYYSSHLDGLQEISANKVGRHVGEIRLWLSVLIDAAKHKDMDFININGKAICEIAKLDYNTVYQSFNNIWELEKC